MNCVQCSYSRCCHGHVVYFSPWHKFVSLKQGISFYFAFLHQRSFPFLVKCYFFFAFVVVAMGREEDCAT